MLTVETDVEESERRLWLGLLACPRCSGVLAGWGRARARQVRGLDGWVLVVPRRSRCTACGATHVLLPVLLLELCCADTAAVIGEGLAAKAAGGGHRVIAAVLGRPPETVRGWLRRFAGRVEPVRAVFTWWCRGRSPLTRCCPGRRGRRGRGRGRGDHRRCRGGRGPVRARHGGVLGGRVGGVVGAVAGPGLAIGDASGVINTS